MHERHQEIIIGKPKDIIIETADKLVEIIGNHGAPSLEILNTIESDNDRYYFTFGHRMGLVDYMTLLLLGSIEDFKGGFVLNEEELLKECFASLSWMVDDMTWRFDQQKSVFSQENQGGYSDELKKAINLVEKLKKILEK